jgi:hypothetical protein
MMVDAYDANGYGRHAHVQAGKVDRAISLLVRHGWWDRLVSLMRTMDPVKDVQQLKAAVAAFKQAGALSACVCLGQLAHALTDSSNEAAMGNPRCAVHMWLVRLVHMWLVHMWLVHTKLTIPSVVVGG